jgi:hypothetical protein
MYTTDKRRCAKGKIADSFWFQEEVETFDEKTLTIQVAVNVLWLKKSLETRDPVVILKISSLSLEKYHET